jgi:hypothetical protein
LRVLLSGNVYFLRMLQSQDQYFAVNLLRYFVSVYILADYICIDSISLQFSFLEFVFQGMSLDLNIC